MQLFNEKSKSKSIRRTAYSALICLACLGSTTVLAGKPANPSGTSPFLIFYPCNGANATQSLPRWGDSIPAGKRFVAEFISAFVYNSSNDPAIGTPVIFIEGAEGSSGEVAVPTVSGRDLHSRVASQPFSVTFDSDPYVWVSGFPGWLGTGSRCNVQLTGYLEDL